MPVGLAAPLPFIAARPGARSTGLFQFVFPGVSGNYMSVPDAVNLQISGNIEIVARVFPTAWVQAVGQDIVNRYQSGTLGWRLFIHTTGVLAFNGPAQAFSSVAAPTSDRWVKATWDGVNARFYTAPDAPTEPVTWTQLGTDRPLAGTSPVALVVPVRIGNSGFDSTPFAGRIARVIVRNGIAGTAVLDVAESNALAAGVTSFTATTGQTVTVNQTAGNTIVQNLP